MINKKGIIYAAFNKINGKAYIGQTISSLPKRITRHYRDSKNHSYAFANALRKYNRRDWDWVVLHNNIDREKLNELEIKEIKRHNSYFGGYNSTTGGEDNPMNYKEYRKKVSESKIGKKRPDMIEVMRNININRIYTDEQRERISEKTSGSNNPMYGKNHTEQSRLKISKSQGAKEFIVLKDGKEVGRWINKAKCGRDLNIDNSSITKCLRGKQSNIKGYQFLFVEDING